MAIELNEHRFKIKKPDVHPLTGAHQAWYTRNLF